MSTAHDNILSVSKQKHHYYLDMPGQKGWIKKLGHLLIKCWQYFLCCNGTISNLWSALELYLQVFRKHNKIMHIMIELVLLSSIELMKWTANFSIARVKSGGKKTCKYAVCCFKYKQFQVCMFQCQINQSPWRAAHGMCDERILKEQSLVQHVLLQLWLHMHWVQLDILVIGQQEHCQDKWTPNKSLNRWWRWNNPCKNPWFHDKEWLTFTQSFQLLNAIS